MRRWLLRLVVSLLVVVAAAVGGVGWYYAGEILNVVEPGDPKYDTTVVSAAADEVVLEDNEAARRPGVWGLGLPEAYARVGAVAATGADGVARPLTPVDGVPQPGSPADIDSYAYPSDPARADFDFAVTERAIEAPLGDQPGWFVQGDPSRWAIFVHGRAGGRHECFRLLPVLVDLGWTSLCASYRNDPGTPADPDGIYRQGATEWLDVEAAVAHALDNGAKSVVLVGYSMGGQITANFLRRSPLAVHVEAVVWDSPLLDWGPVIAAAAEDRGVPSWLVPLGMEASEMRAGVDYAALNQIRHADEFTQPILLLHGDADATVPPSVSERFAAARPDLVTFEQFPGAGHVQSWNLDTERYERAVRDFLTTHAPTPECG